MFDDIFVADEPPARKRHQQKIVEQPSRGLSAAANGAVPLPLVAAVAQASAAINATNYEGCLACQ